MHIDVEIRHDVAVLSVSEVMTTGLDVAPFHERIKALAKWSISEKVLRISGSLLPGFVDREFIH